MTRRKLSKSRYLAGLQCDRQLWWRVHEPWAPELKPDAGLQAVFDNGHAVGEAARARFPGGVLIDLDPRNLAAALKATGAAIEAGAQAIFEACFVHDGVFAAVDVLHRDASGNGWVITEVKSTLSVKDTHLDDLALQWHVVSGCGLQVTRAELMHLNRNHRHPDEQPLFARNDVTDDVGERTPGVAPRISHQLHVIQGDLPETAVGPHCSEPYECAFHDRCWPAREAHGMHELYGAWSRASALHDLHVDHIAEIPEDFPLPAIARRQRRAIRAGEVVIEGDLAGTLAELGRTLAFLDFETIALPLPRWAGCAPYQSVPVQHSVHRLEAGGHLTHTAFLAEGADDPRPALARHLLQATEGADHVLAWYAPFEEARIRELADALPGLRQRLLDLAERLVDLLPVFRHHVYHPDFRGSFSLKRVVSALLPEHSYERLEVQDGGVATVALQRHLLGTPDLRGTERAALRESLLRYCNHDTFVLVELWRWLDSHARPIQEPGRVSGVHAGQRSAEGA